MQYKQVKIGEAKYDKIMMARDYHFKISRGITIVTHSREECPTSLT